MPSLHRTAAACRRPPRARCPCCWSCRRRDIIVLHEFLHCLVRCQHVPVLVGLTRHGHHLSSLVWDELLAKDGFIARVGKLCRKSQFLWRQLTAIHRRWRSPLLLRLPILQRLSRLHRFHHFSAIWRWLLRRLRRLSLGWSRCRGVR